MVSLSYQQATPEGGEGSSQWGAEELDEGEDDDGQGKHNLQDTQKAEQRQAPPVIAQSQTHDLKINSGLQLDTNF